MTFTQVHTGAYEMNAQDKKTCPYCQEEMERRQLWPHMHGQCPGKKREEKPYAVRQLFSDISSYVEDEEEEEPCSLFDLTDSDAPETPPKRPRTSTPRRSEDLRDIKHGLTQLTAAVNMLAQGHAELVRRIDYLGQGVHVIPAGVKRSLQVMTRESNKFVANKLAKITVQTDALSQRVNLKNALQDVMDDVACRYGGKL